MISLAFDNKMNLASTEAHHSGADDIIIDAILSGKKQYFTTLYHRYNKDLFVVALRYFHNRTESEDALQNAWIKIYENLKKYNSEKSAFLTWSKKLQLTSA